MLSLVQKKYVLTEGMIGLTIGAIFSLVFALALFGGQVSVALWGSRSIILDALPQTFMIALTGTLVPTLLARWRIRHGILKPITTVRKFRPTNVVYRSFMVAFAVTTIGVGLHVLVLPRLTPPTWPLMWVVVFKTLYGGSIGIIVSRFAVRAAMSDDIRLVDPPRAS